ncbi:MAG: DHH family phosphoesterase [Ardenticatenaceae bacterium]|nr:DHH family phosphoesterase [Ardenticatenaceae bacterium]
MPETDNLSFDMLPERPDDPPRDGPISPNRLAELRAIAGAGPVLILTHDNPDPDALASGKACAALLKSAWDISSRLLYSGLIQRAENRALLNLLTPEWEHSNVLPQLDQFSAVALIDTQPGAGNNRLPVSHIPQIVIDHHHPIRKNLPLVPYADVRPEIGATATLLDQYLEAAGIVVDSNLATAMFYALKTDTRGLSRGASSADEVVYLKLLAQIDHSKLIQIEQAGLSRIYFRAFSRGLRAARVYTQSVVANLEMMHRPDLAAELADILIRFEEAEAVLCLGIYEQILHLSIRTRPMGQDAGLLVQQVIVPPGKAGGHGTMAGGQVPLAGQKTNQLVGEIVDRFLQVMGETGKSESLC